MLDSLRSLVAVGRLYKTITDEVHTKDIVSLSAHLLAAASHSHALAVAQCIRIIAQECADAVADCVGANNAACTYAAAGLDVSDLIKHTFLSFKALIGSGGIWSDSLVKYFDVGAGDCVVDAEVGKAFLVVALNYGSVFSDIETLNAVFAVCLEMDQDTDLVVAALTKLASPPSIPIKDSGKRLTTLGLELYGKQQYYQALIKFEQAANWYRDKRDYEAFLESVGYIGTCLLALAGVYSVISAFVSLDSIDSLDSVGKLLQELWQTHGDDFTRGIVAWDDGIKDQLVSFSYTAHRAGLFIPTQDVTLMLSLLILPFLQLHATTLILSRWPCLSLLFQIPASF